YRFLIPRPHLAKKLFPPWRTCTRIKSKINTVETEQPRVMIPKPPSIKLQQSIPANQQASRFWSLYRLDPTRSIAHQIGSSFKAINHFVNMLRPGLYPNIVGIDRLVKEVIDLCSYSPIIYIIIKLTIPAFEIAFPMIKGRLLD